MSRFKCMQIKVFCTDRDWDADTNLSYKFVKLELWLSYVLNFYGKPLKVVTDALCLHESFDNAYSCSGHRSDALLCEQIKTNSDK